MLLGEYPENLAQELAKPDLIPSMPDAAAPGVPLDLLKRRPDIQRGRARARGRHGAHRRRDGEPLSAGRAGGFDRRSAGAGPRRPRQTLGKHIWSFGPAAVWPLLDFGALDAEVDIADLEAHASLVNYRKTILNAVREVDNALDAYDAQRSRLDDLGRAMLAGQRAVDLATERYNRGLTDFLNVVDAERQYYDLQEQYAVGANRQRTNNSCSSTRVWAAAGRTTARCPPIRRPQPAIVAAFRRTLSGAAQ